MRAYLLLVAGIGLFACGGSETGAPIADSSGVGDAPRSDAVVDDVDSDFDAATDGPLADTSSVDSADSEVPGDSFVPDSSAESAGDDGAVDGGTCNDLDAGATSVHIQLVDTPNIAFSGGTISPGTYTLDSYNYYTGPGGATGTKATKLSGTLVIVGTPDGLDIEGDLREDGKPDGAYHWIRGTVGAPGKLHVTVDCPSSSVSQYTANYVVEASPDAGLPHLFLNDGSQYTAGYALQP